MSESKFIKHSDGLEKTTKMPKALRALVAAVGASALGLLGLSSAFANVSNPPAVISETRSKSNASKPKLLLNQVGGQLQLAGGGGHESHASHASHESHASHASGGYR